MKFSLNSNFYLTIFPFLFQVVQACVSSGAHHIDISGEPQFLEKMQLKYHAEAESKGVYIVGACGFDSIPSDVGRQLIHKEMGGGVNSVEMFLEVGRDGPAKGKKSILGSTYPVHF